MTRRYVVDLVRDQGERLRDQLNEIAQGGGRVVSVMWTPTRDVLYISEGGHRQHAPTSSGYTIVSEYDFPD